MTKIYRKNCFAYIHKYKCGALIKCDCTNCCFYKIRGSVDKETKELIDRERKLLQTKDPISVEELDLLLIGGADHV